jgi:hypothetical protein
MWLLSGDRYCTLRRCRVCLSGALALRGIWVPIRIYRAMTAATVNDGWLTLVNAVIVTVPTRDVALVCHVAPTGISVLVSMACPYVKA